MLRWVTWNIFLALIPVVLAYALAWGLGRGKQRRLPLILCLPLALAWLAFLPNTCYLLTEWRHLLFDPQWAEILDMGDTNRRAMLSTAKWSLFFLAYSGAGVLLFVLAIRPIERWLRLVGHRFIYYAPPLFFLTSLGVYLGLIVRFNSWDLLHRPLMIWNTAVDAVLHPNTLTPIVVFAILLWGLYEAVDLWVDGIMDRLHRWGFLPAATRLRTA